MADLRYKVVVDDAEAKRKLAELLKGTGVSSPMGGMADDAKKATASIDEVRAAQVRMKDAQTASINAIRQYREELTAQKKAQSDLQIQYLQGKISAQEYALGQKKIADAQKEAARQARETKRALSENREYNKLTAELNRLRNATKDALAELVRMERQGQKNSVAYKQLSASTKEMVANTNLLDRTVKKIDVTVGQHQRNVGNYGDAIAMVAPQISQFAGRMGLLGAAVAGVKQSFDSNLRMEPITQSLKFASGSTTEFQKNLDFLRESSDRLGLEFISTATSFKLWQGAAKFSNLTADESRKIFESVANASAKMKLSNDQVQGTFLALSQIMSKGKVQAEELRGQLGERLPGAFSLAAKAMGVTEQELNKMLEKGEVLASDFLPRFAAQLDTSFGNDKTERIEGMQASVNRLKNEFDALWQSERASKFFSTVSDGLASLTSNFNKFINSGSVKEFFARFAGVFNTNTTQQTIARTLGDAQLAIDKNKGTETRGLVSYKEMADFYDLTREEQKKAIKAQETIVKLQTEEFKNNKNNLKMRENMLWNSEKLAKMRAKVGADPVIGGVTKAGGKDDKTAERAAERGRQAFERQRSLQAQIDALAESSTRKQLSRDEEELASITDKYAKIREQVDKFYRDPKNKGQRVDMGKLASAERFELNEATTRQGTRELVKQLGEQREVYAEYNTYVEQNGIEAAEKMFGKQSELAKDYRATLQREYTAITTLQKSASVLAFTGIDVKLTQAQEERAKALKEILESLDKEDRARQMAKYAEALKMAETFTDKETKVRKAHNDALAQLGKDATQDQKDAIDNVLKNELQAIIESEPKLKEAMEAISNAQAWVLPEAIENGKQMIVNLISGMKQKYPELTKVLEQLEKQLLNPLNIASDAAKDRKWGVIEEAVSGFEQLVNHAANFDDSLKGSLLTIADMLTTVGQLSRTLSNSGLLTSEVFKNIGGSFPIIGAVAGIVGSIIGIFEKGAEKRRQREAEDAKYAYEYQSKQIESITKALQYQLQLVEDIYGVERVKAYGKAISDANKSANDSISKVNSSQKYQLTGDRLIDEWITNRNNGKQNFFGDNYLDSMISSGAIKKLELGFSRVEDITQEHLINLHKMVNDGGLDEATRTQVQNILDQYEIWKDGTNKLKEELLGISFRGVLDVTKDLFFNNGENAADAWQKGFDNVMKDYLKNLFSREFLEKELQAFYDKYDELAKSGDRLTDVEKAELEGLWKNIEKNGKDRLDQLQKDLNIDLSDNASSGSLGSEGIARATEEQFSEYLGINRAIWDLNKQQLELLRSTHKSQVDYVGVANASLTRLNSIDMNTANTVKELQTAIVHLKNIDGSLSKKFV